jgi:hypothetical protein
VKRLMKAADIFFLPSRWEGIALSLYEAMASGLAVVGADVGGQRELVTPECGILVPPRDETADAARYADAVSGLLRDPGRRRDMGKAGRERIAAHFRLERMRVQMVALYEEATRLRLTEPRPRPARGLASACAAQAVEYVRLARVAEQLWAERNGPGWRGSVYRWLGRSFSSSYHWAVARGCNWLVPLSQRIRQALLHPA